MSRADLGRSVRRTWRKTTGALGAARIFISHSSQLPDVKIGDAIAVCLARMCNVQYDRSDDIGIGASVIELGEPVLPLDAIFGCDLFLFVASARSVREESVAFRELRAAVDFGLWVRGRVGVLPVDDCETPAFMSERLFQRVRSEYLDEDCEKVARQVSRKLLSLGGVIELPGTFLGGAKPAVLLDRLLNFAPKASLYEMDLPLQKWATNQLMHELEKMGRASRDAVVSRLFDIVCARGPALLKNNAIYMISRLQSGEPGIAVDLLRFGGLHSDPYSRLSLGTASAIAGRGEVLRSYISCLLSDTPEGQKLRRHHKEYHIFYYGGFREAVNALRKELVAKIQPRLLPLTVCTFSLLENSSFGLELFSSQMGSLRERDVDRNLIRWASERLAHRR